MSGIVGAVSGKNIAAELLECLKQLEYQGFDCANIMVVNESKKIQRIGSVNRVSELQKQLQLHPLQGKTGIANTNWSRSNIPNKYDSHPTIAGDEIALVQNGLLENYDGIKSKLRSAGYTIATTKDSELIGYLIHDYMKSGQTSLNAIRSAEQELQGSFSICFIDRQEPDRLKAFSRGSNLIIGLGQDENYVSSDVISLIKKAKRFIYLEDGDIADITNKSVDIYDSSGKKVERKVLEANSSNDLSKMGKYNHAMLKEIYDQPDTIAKTLQGRLNDEQVLVESFGMDANDYFSRIHRVKIVASGASFHAGLVGRYWLEAISGLPCQVELASENRYREKMAESNTLFVTLSQSGETPDTLNALRIANNLGYIATLTIGNAPQSPLVRESDLVLITGGGTGESLTAIKDFTSELSALSLLAVALGRHHRLDDEKEAVLAKKLRKLPLKARDALKLDPVIETMTPLFDKHQRAMYLGNGIQLPVAMEGAMRLKEVSMINAEAFHADDFDKQNLFATQEPIVALATHSDPYFDAIMLNATEKNKNMIIFVDEELEKTKRHDARIVGVPFVDKLLAPMTYVIPTQLLAYHVAVSKGADTDKPRYDRAAPIVL